MFRHILGSRAAGAAAGAVAGVAAGSGTTVHARAPVQVAPQHTEHRSSAGGKCLDDEWLILQPPHGDILLMKPFQACEVDEAVADVAKLMQPHGRALGAIMQQEPGSPNSSEPSTPTSQGSAADSQIAHTFLTGSAMYASSNLEDTGVTCGAQGIDISTLLDLTSKMLKRPGMQVELVKAMMEDREIQEILLREGNDLDNYLLAVGAAPVRSLLPAAAAAATVTEDSVHQERHAEANNEHSVLVHLVNGVVSALEHAGSGVGQLLGWLRSRVAMLLHGPEETATAVSSDGKQQEAQGDPANKNRGANKARVVLQGVLAVAAVVVVVMIFKRPPSFRRAASFARR